MSLDLNFIDELIQEPATKMSFADAVKHFESRGMRYELEERAAILEYDAGFTRHVAEKRAVKELLDQTG